MTVKRIVKGDEADVYVLMWNGLQDALSSEYSKARSNRWRVLRQRYIRKYLTMHKLSEKDTGKL